MRQIFGKDSKKSPLIWKSGSLRPASWDTYDISSRHILIWISTRGPGLDSERDGSETDGDPVGMERKNGRDIVKDTIGNDESTSSGR